MANVGEEMVNPVSRERFAWRHTSASTGGAYCEFDLHLGEGAVVGAPHVHPGQQERFEIKRGLIRLRSEGREELLCPGDVRTIEPGTTHSWGNADSGEPLVTVRLTPALRSEAFFMSFCRVANEGHANAKAMPRNPLRLAILAHEYRDVARLPGAAGSAPALAILGALARWSSSRYPHLIDTTPVRASRSGQEPARPDCRSDES
jgi:quercetin dioxygenase-like cupin family protein